VSRVVFGASCCWWDGIEAAAQTATGLPCCPHCGGVLHELEEESWWRFARDHAAENKDPRYVEFLEWLRGQCFQHVDVARRAFEPQTTEY
jgi:hypothetical protein